MVPETSSPSASLKRTGVAFSIRCFRYLTSSKVCSGARVLAFPPLFAVLFLLLRAPRDDGSPGAARRVLGITIIAVARGDPQIGTLHPHLDLVKAAFGERHVLRIVAQQVLRTKFRDYLGKGLVEAVAEAGDKHAAAGALRDGGESILAADIAAGIVGDRHDQHRVDHGV